jgi:DNA-directed RNA polymerase subunit RPC12/RpoP
MLRYIMRQKGEGATTMDQKVVCQKCGSENAAGLQFCGTCGAKLPAVAQKGEIACPACGFQNPPSQHFCGNCGVKLPTPGEAKVQEISCPTCGSKNPADRHFCGVCGASLAPPVAVAQVAAPVVTKPAASTPGEVAVRPTWGLAWGLFWRIALLWLLFGGIAYLILYLLMLSKIVPPLQGS